LATWVLISSVLVVKSEAQSYPLSTVVEGPRAEVSVRSRELVPVPYPDLSNMEEVVQKQLREAQSGLESVRQRPGSTDTQLSHAYGEMGRLYQAYELIDPALACFLNAHTLAQ